MTAQSVWDDPDLKAGGEFVSFENVGDGVSGIINAVRTHTFDDGKKVPQILITTDEGEERTATCGQVRLKAELNEQRPEKGDHISIKLASIEKRSGGKTLKHFDVVVSRGGAPKPEPTPAASAGAAPTEDPASTIDPAAAAAALANLSDEQKKQLGLI